MIEGTQQDSLDPVKIYIIAMGVLCILIISWLLYNYLALAEYQENLVYAIEDIDNILRYETKLPPKSRKTKEQKIVDFFKFFKYSVHDIPPLEASRTGWEPGSLGNKLYEEKRYTIQFKSISRKNLARYIYKICQSKKFLKLKQINLRKADNIKAYEDKWKAELVFAQRRPPRKRN